MTQREIQLACRLLFVDLEGLNNGRAVKTIVPQINPRKMVSPPGKGTPFFSENSNERF